MLEDERREAGIVPVGVVDDADHAVWRFGGRIWSIENSRVVGADKVTD